MLRFINIFCCLAILNAGHAQTVGLISTTPASKDGYVLFAPLSGTNTFLIDKCGYVVNTWTAAQQPGNSVYLMDNGNLLRSAKTANTVFTAGGYGGKFEVYDWNSNLLWSYTRSNTIECQHHDVYPLPNGNVLMLIWDLKSPAEALAAGRSPQLTGTSVWSEKIIEVQQTGPNTGNVVWEWYVWDHLVQDYDSLQANYGVVSDHPELIDVNFAATTNPDWLHANGIDYNAELDQIILSVHRTDEFWVIDHSTTTAEAASHSGGLYGRGGDLLYRWGNPQAYGRGTVADQKLFGQHNPQWIKSGNPDAGKILVFNNGLQRPAGNYSTVEIIDPPVTATGNYVIANGMPFMPDTAFWMYSAPVPTDFYAQNISGAQRLSNGNTLICEGPSGNFFEIDAAGNTVWQYISPVGANGNILSQGSAPLSNSVFRCQLYEPSFPGFAGKPMTPGSPLELNPLPYNCTMLTGVSELQTSIDFSIVNPVKERIRFRAALAGDYEIRLVDISGKQAGQWSFPGLNKDEPVDLPLEGVAAGMYLLQIRVNAFAGNYRLVIAE